jgi:hypothetical protein
MEKKTVGKKRKGGEREGGNKREGRSKKRKKTVDTLWRRDAFSISTLSPHYTRVCIEVALSLSTSLTFLPSSIYLLPFPSFPTPSLYA